MEEKNLHSIIDIIKNNDFKAYYIIDSNKESFSLNGEVPYEKYRTKYNKLVPNSLFLYRQPKRLAKNRKFNIYGGGIIYKIVAEDDMFTAYIKDGFVLLNPIIEDDKHLVDMIWTSKTKTNGWDHFWSQYGINEINEEDMLNIMEESDFVYIKDREDLMPQNVYEGTILKDKMIRNNMAHGLMNRNESRYNRNRPRNIIANLLVDLENEKLEFLGIDKKAVALDGHEKIEKGYDVLSYDSEGKEMHIGIKMQSYGSGRLDHVNRRDYELFKDPNYYLYTFYNIDIDNLNEGKYDINIEKGIDLLEKYDFVPLMYSARLKKEEKEK